MYLEPVGIEQTIRGAFPVWNYLQSDSELYGVDLTLSYDFSESFNFSNKSAYTKGNNIDANRPLINIPAFNTKNSVTYKNDNWKNFSVSLTSEWTAEQTEFPDNNFETFVAATNESILVDFSTPPNAFHLLHLYSEITFKTSNYTDLNVAVSINNLLDTKYRAYLNRLRYFADDVGRNIMLQLQFNF